MDRLIAHWSSTPTAGRAAGNRSSTDEDGASQQSKDAARLNGGCFTAGGPAAHGGRPWGCWRSRTLRGEAGGAALAPDPRAAAGRRRRRHEWRGGGAEGRQAGSGVAAVGSGFARCPGVVVGIVVGNRGHGAHGCANHERWPPSAGPPTLTVDGRADKRASAQACQLCLDAIFDGTLEALLDLSGVLAFTVLLAVRAGCSTSLPSTPFLMAATCPADRPTAPPSTPGLCCFLKALSFLSALRR